MDDAQINYTTYDPPQHASSAVDSQSTPEAIMDDMPMHSTSVCRDEYPDPAGDWLSMQRDDHTMLDDPDLQHDHLSMASDMNIFGISPISMDQAWVW